MSTSPLTGSQLERLIACAGSAALPQANTSSAYTEQGHGNHAEQEDAINAGELPEDVARILGDAAPTARAEVQVAYDVAEDEGRIIGQGSGRDYPTPGPFEIFATVDVLAHDAERVYVLDRKLYSAVTGAERNVQVGFGALAAARALGRSQARVALLYEARKPDIADLDSIDMALLAGKLRDLHGRVAEQRGRRARGELVEVAQGPHCKWCPAVHACPASNALIRQLLEGGNASEASMMAPLTPDNVGAAYVQFSLVEMLYKRMKTAIIAYASHTPIPLGGKRFYGRHTKLGNERLAGTVVRDVVRDALGPEAVDEVVTYEATKSALKEAIAKRVPKGKGAETERALLAMIRERGGASREETTTIEEYEAELALVGGGS